jgi:hypothetical protein
MDEYDTPLSECITLRMVSGIEVFFYLERGLRWGELADFPSEKRLVRTKNCHLFKKGKL